MQLARSFVACVVFWQLALNLIAGVNLFWDPPTSGTSYGYNIYRSSTSGTGFLLLNSQVVTTCSYRDDGVTPGNTYYYVVKSVSQCGAESQSSNELAISVAAVNNSPAAYAGSDRTVASGQAVSLSGSGSDPDGDPLTFTWSQTAGPAVKLRRTNQPSLAFTAPVVTSQTFLSFRLKVSDGREGSDTDDVIVTVFPTNQAPTANAGPDQTVKAGQTVVLEGSGSDSDGDQLSYSWTQVAGPAVSLSGADKPSASFVAPEVDSKSTASFRLTVSDGKGGTGNDDVSVALRPLNQKPNAMAGTGQTVLSGETVMLQGEGSDPDGDPLTYSWSQLSGPLISLTSSHSATIQFRAPESRRRVRLSFEFIVADNYGETATDRVDITVRPNHFDPFSSPANIPGIDQVFSEAYVAAAIVNRADVSRDISVSLIDDNGVERRQIELSRLPPNGQRAFVPGSVCSFDTATLLFDEAYGELKGMFALADRRMTRLDGISGNNAPAERLFLPLLRKPSEKVLLSLFNAGDGTARVKLLLHDGGNGKALREVVRPLPRHGTLVASPADLFGVDPTTLDTYIEAESNEPLTGFQVLGSESAYSSLAAQPAVESAELWLPHFALGSPDLSTTLRLLNAGTTGRLSIRIEAYADDGTAIVSRTLYLKPGEIASKNLMTFGTKIRNRSGYIRVTASQPSGSVPSLVGAVQFTGNNGAFASAVSLQPTGYSTTLFPQIAQAASQGIFTGVALLNPSSEAAHVFVRSFLSDGTLHREIALRLEPGTRVVDLLDGKTFFGEGFEQMNGHLLISSDLPVVSMVLWGDYGSNYLAAVEGQEVE